MAQLTPQVRQDLQAQQDLRVAAPQAQQGLQAQVQPDLPAVAPRALQELQVEARQDLQARPGLQEMVLQATPGLQERADLLSPQAQPVALGLQDLAALVLLE